MPHWRSTRGLIVTPTNPLGHLGTEYSLVRLCQEIRLAWLPPLLPDGYQIVSQFRRARPLLPCRGEDHDSINAVAELPTILDPFFTAFIHSRQRVEPASGSFRAVYDIGFLVSKLSVRMAEPAAGFTAKDQVKGEQP